ncbi:Pentatricopeptide repeat-containing protein At5g61400, partial [Durusdinium trenchii]
AFMDLAAVHQDLHLAVRSFHELTQVFMPSVTTYNTLLLAFARGGDLRAAQQWLRRMVALTEEPNEVTYRILIQCCAQAGDLLSAAGYLEEMEAQHLTVDVTTRNILANAAAEAGDAAFAKEFWQQLMTSTTTTPDAFSFNAVLKAQLAAGDLPGAEEHFHKFFAAAGRTVQPDLTTFGMLINAYAEVKDHRQALSWQLWCKTELLMQRICYAPPTVAEQPGRGTKSSTQL